MAPVRLASVSVAEERLALVRLALVRLALVSVAEERLALVRLALVSVALVNVAKYRLALVRFWPEKFQPVRLLPVQADALQVLGLIAGGAVEL